MEKNKMKYESGNSALLIAYREALITAFKLGEEIKLIYSIVPPAVLCDDLALAHPHRLSLNVSQGLKVSQTS